MMKEESGDDVGEAAVRDEEAVEVNEDATGLPGETAGEAAEGDKEATGADAGEAEGEDGR